MTIYFDFDGTLVDVWERYYYVLETYLSNRGYQCDGTIKDYKREKLLLRKDHLVAERLWNAPIDIADYLIYKRSTLEAEKFLRLDRPIKDFSGVVNNFIRKGYKIVLLSLRRHPAMLYKELDWLGYKNCFDNIIVLNPDREKKQDWLAQRVTNGDVLVGDSLGDLQVNIKGIKAFFVKTGLNLYDETFLHENGITTIGDYTEIIKDYG